MYLHKNKFTRLFCPDVWALHISFLNYEPLFPLLAFFGFLQLVPRRECSKVLSNLLVQITAGKAWHSPTPSFYHPFLFCVSTAQQNNTGRFTLMFCDYCVWFSSGSFPCQIAVIFAVGPINSRKKIEYWHQCCPYLQWHQPSLDSIGSQ